MNFIEEQQREDWQLAKWVLEPTDPLLNWKKGWNEGGDAAVTAFIQHLLESGLLEEKDVPASTGDEAFHGECNGHNTLARDIKEFMSNMDKV